MKLSIHLIKYISQIMMDTQDVQIVLKPMTWSILASTHRSGVEKLD